MRRASKLMAVLCATALALSALAQTVVAVSPYSTLNLPDGGDYSITVSVDYPKPGPWLRTLNGSLPLLVKDHWVQIMVEGSDGWRHTFLKIGANGKPLPTRHNDPNFRLDSPWRRADGTYQSGWYRVWPPQPPGWISPSHNELNVRPLVTVTTNRSKIALTTKGAPAEGIQLHGSHNSLTVDVQGGPKAWLQTDRCEVRVYGDWNRVTGRIKTEMVALRFNGSYNEAHDVTAEGCEVGNDVGLFVFVGTSGYVGNRLTDVLGVCAKRQYPVSWCHAGAYLDQWAAKSTLVRCTFVGFQTAVFGHGASDTRIEALRSVNCEVGVNLAPHFTKPSEIPFNFAPSFTSIGTVADDRRVPRLVPDLAAHQGYIKPVLEGGKVCRYDLTRKGDRLQEAPQ